ncbi:putative membrane protein [Nymphaea thermarum]|nr:putative membrane protein [Nymphaea thermarum]
MKYPTGFWPGLCRFLFFLPFFFGLLLLGIIKGGILCPLICLFITIGNSAVVLGLWPAHAFWTYYCIIRSKQLGPVLKAGLCVCITVLLVLWPLVSISGSILGGAVYGFLSPLVATFEAVGEGRTDEFVHCLIDGTWSSLKRSFTVVRDFADVCFHSYFSIMDDLRNQEPPGGEPLDIRVFSLPGAVIIGLLGVIIDVPVISLIAIYKSPFMLIKGWHRLIHDLVGREGPFLETACVPFAGLAILLWPIIVVGAVVSSLTSSIFLGAYAAVVTYQESSAFFGLSYVVSCISIFDEYCNDMLDMSEGSCFPRLPYTRKQASQSAPPSRPSSFNRRTSGRLAPSRSMSLKNAVIEIKPIELFDRIFDDCKHHGERLVNEGAIAAKDIEEWTSRTSPSLSIGLLAYCILQGLLRSAKANCSGYLLGDNVTEITSSNRPREVIFDRFFDPLMTIKEQIKAMNLSEEEESYLCKLVLSGGSGHIKVWNVGSLPASNVKHAQAEALARRLKGIAKMITRFPTFRRKFEDVLNSLPLEPPMQGDSRRSVNSSRSIVRTRSNLSV